MNIEPDKSYDKQSVKKFKKLLRRVRPDIVHTHAALSGRVAAWLCGKTCKIIHTRHSVFEPSRWQTRFPMRQILGAVNNFFSDAIIAVSPAAKDNLLALGVNGHKIHIIFNGMPPAREYSRDECALLRQKYNVPPDAFVLAQIARLTEVKGQDDVLAAACQWPDDVIVLMAGDGELRPHLEARIKNEDIKNVRLLGFVDAVEELFAIMDVQLSASFGTEATSLALIQGMSVGKPAVVTDYGGNPYVISDGENGIVVPTRDPNALAAAVTRLRGDAELYAYLSKNSRECYARKFTLQEMIKNIENLYREMKI